MTPLVVSVAVLALAPDAYGQAAGSPSPPTWDAAVQVGVLMGRPDGARVAGTYDSWFEAPQMAIVAGRYLSTHLKAEVELSAAGEGEQFVPQTIPASGSPFPVYLSTDRFTRVSSVQGSLVWQFLDNQWAHPFIQVGASLSGDRVRIRTWPQPVRLSGRDPNAVASEPETVGPTTSYAVGLVVGAGAKLYVTPRLFVRTDTRLTARPDATDVAFRAGVGIDF